MSPQGKLDIGPGSFLVASPSLLDPNFRRTVVLICEHGEQGSVGLVVNRPTPYTLTDVVRDADLPDSVTEQNDTVFNGGPVELDRLMVIRRGSADADNASLQHVGAGVYLVVDISSTLHRLKDTGGDLSPYRFFLGYAGWGEGQLDAELKEGAWFLHPSSDDLVFSDSVNSSWKRVLRESGGINQLYAEMPHDPKLN